MHSLCKYKCLQKKPPQQLSLVLWDILQCAQYAFQHILSNGVRWHVQDDAEFTPDAASVRRVCGVGQRIPVGPCGGRCPNVTTGRRGARSARSLPKLLTEASRSAQTFGVSVLVSCVAIALCFQFFSACFCWSPLRSACVRFALGRLQALAVKVMPPVAHGLQALLRMLRWLLLLLEVQLHPPSLQLLLCSLPGSERFSLDLFWM